jgi:hypothetical protein
MSGVDFSGHKYDDLGCYGPDGDGPLKRVDTVMVEYGEGRRSSRAPTYLFRTT